MTKFLLMGLPATGKTTTLEECVKFLKKQGIACNFVSTDILIKKRMNGKDGIVQQYAKDHGLEISPAIFAAGDPLVAFIQSFGEPALRNLEERLLIDIIKSAGENDWLDFGARALLLPGVIKATEDKKIIPIFLYANHETILARLAKDEGWKQRPTYVVAAEKSPDGWKTNAEAHRKERLAQYIRSAAIIISVEKTPDEASKSIKEEKRDTIVYKTPEEIVREIFMRVRELEQATLAGGSPSTRQYMKFFESKPDEKVADKKKLKDKKEWLENNLKLRRT